MADVFAKQGKMQIARSMYSKVNKTDGNLPRSVFCLCVCFMFHVSYCRWHILGTAI